MSYTILWDHLSIIEIVKNLFNTKTRPNKRIILINYLDEILPTMLPDVQNVNIYCYPQPGNIDPYALENLQNKGANIFFTNPINTNIFYVENEGFLLGSANYNYTKNVIKCYNKVKDIMIFIKDYSIIDIEYIIQSLDIIFMKQKDLAKLKEEHHIFWRTYDGFEDLLNSFTNKYNYIDNFEENINKINIIKDIINVIKKLIPFRKPKKTSESLIDDKFASNVKYGLKDVNFENNNKTNVYCLSKDDLFDMLSKHLHENKMKVNKRKMH